MQIYLILLLLQIIHCCYGQGTPATATAISTTSTSSTNTITTTTSNDIIRTTMPTVTATNSSNATITTTRDNTTSGGTQTTFYSPSPTSFVYTHFPAFPIRTGSSSSIMSSARPSQSAPLPDDTIGKYGRLHISKASRILNLSHFPFGCTILCCIFALYLA